MQNSKLTSFCIEYFHDLRTFLWFRHWQQTMVKEQFFILVDNQNFYFWCCLWQFLKHSQILWYSFLQKVGPLPLNMDSTEGLLPNRQMWQKWQCGILTLGHQNGLVASSFLSLESLVLGEARYHVITILKSSMERSTWLQPAIMWVS